MFLKKLNYPEDWKQFLADPDKHWKNNFSAKSLAYTWQNSGGFPKHVKEVIGDCINFKDIEFLFGIPEYKVMLPGGSRASQNDIFVLSKTSSELIPIMVEGKVDESFGTLVSEWLNNNSDSIDKQERLNFLINLLGLKNSSVESIRYQLLHRTASVVIESKRLFAKKGIMLVHSFSESNKSFSDYNSFLNLYSLNGVINKTAGPVSIDGVQIYFAWVKDSFPKFQ